MLARIPETIERSPGDSYQRVLDRDTRTPPDILREERPCDLGVEPVAARRYTSRDFFLKEVEKVFLKTWQYACRAEDIPNPGDTHVYDLLDKSVLLIRQPDGAIRGFQNVCLHRGRKLATLAGRRTQLRCPYHGFTWNIDGSFRENPFKWDFPQIDEAQLSLPELRVESWAGFVFVNFDSGAETLMEQIEPLARHMERWRIGECYKAAHVAKVAPANWKVCAEAFIETNHVLTTHPQVVDYTALEASQYDLLNDHVTRFITAVGVTGAHGRQPPLSEQEKMNMMFGVRRRAESGGAGRDLDPGMTARIAAADAARKALSELIGDDLSHVADAEVLDSIAYDFFPNFHLWGGFGPKICYRFRPLGMDHEQTLVEIMLFKIAPRGQPKPPPSPMRLLSEDQPWSEGVELGYLAGIYDQDQSNFGPLQQGLRNLGEGHIHFSRYQEMRCRNLHRMVDRYISRP